MSDGSPVDRRELFRIIGAGVVAIPAAQAQQHSHEAAAAAASGGTASYAPRVLNAAQYETLGRMLELLLPADEASPSAREAGVGRYLDTVLQYADDGVRLVWRSGLDTVGKEFAAGPDELAVLTRIAERELRPESEPERFFVIFKQAAVTAYYLSEGGRKALGYSGDTAIREFPGCTHAEHKTK